MLSQTRSLRARLKEYADLINGWDAHLPAHVSLNDALRKEQILNDFTCAGFTVYERWDEEAQKRVFSLEWAAYPKDDE